MVHTTMKRQMKTKKGRGSLNTDDLIKNKNLINELTSSRFLKKSYKYAYTQAHIIYKTESYFMLHPINVTNGKHLMYATSKKNKRICNILIFQNIFETVTFIHIYTKTAQTFVT